MKGLCADTGLNKVDDWSGHTVLTEPLYEEIHAVWEGAHPHLAPSPLP